MVYFWKYVVSRTRTLAVLYYVYAIYDGVGLYLELHRTLSGMH